MTFSYTCFHCARERAELAVNPPTTRLPLAEFAP